MIVLLDRIFTRISAELAPMRIWPDQFRFAFVCGAQSGKISIELLVTAKVMTWILWINEFEQVERTFNFSFMIEWRLWRAEVAVESGWAEVLKENVYVSCYRQ